MFAVQGGMQSFAVFMPQVAAGAGWAVARVAVASSTAAAGAVCANLLIGRALKRTSPKLTLSVGILAYGLQNLVFYVSPSPLVFALGGVLGGLAMGWGTVASCSIIIDAFFVEDRSKFMAITVTGAMFGSVAFNPLAAALIGRFGWRTAYLVQGAVVLALGLAAVALLIGELPERERESAETKALAGLTAAEARCTASYWLLALGIFLIGLSTNIENYMPAFWQSRGLGEMHSSLVMSAYAAMAALISILMGRVNDRFSGKGYVGTTSALFVLALLAMARTGAVERLPLLLLCCLPFAAGAKKASSLVPPLVVAEAFGRRDYASLIGFFAAMLQAGVMASNFVIGALLDCGYPVTLSAMAAVNLAGLLCIVLALRNAPIAALR